MSLWKEPDDWDWVDWLAVSIAIILVITVIFVASGGFNAKDTRNGNVTGKPTASKTGNRTGTGGR